MRKLFSPFKGVEAGGQLVELCSLLVLHSIVEELTNSVHLLVAEVATGAEVERQGGELHMDAAAATSYKDKSLQANAPLI